jgi:ribulose-phosphate 3-epimerase
MMKSYKIGASVICMNHLNYFNDIKICEDLGIDYFHIDVMDFDYVPRLGLFPELVHNIAQHSTLDIDIHLMVNDVINVFENFAPFSNVSNISFHLDGNAGSVYKIYDRIKSYGIGVTLVVNLSSSLEHIAQILSDNIFDAIMFMGIHPGVLKQVHRPSNVINSLKFFKSKGLLPNTVQCDGAINNKTVSQLYSNGINSFVCGSSTLFNGLENIMEFNERKDLVSNNLSLLNQNLEKNV